MSIHWLIYVNENTDTERHKFHTFTKWSLLASSRWKSLRMQEYYKGLQRLENILPQILMSHLKVWTSSLDLENMKLHLDQDRDFLVTSPLGGEINEVLSMHC